MLECEVDLRLRIPCPAQRVGGERRVELPVTVRGIVKAGDGLIEGLGRKLVQHALKAAEGDGALVEILRTLGGLEAQAVLNEIIDAPVFALVVTVPQSAVHRRDKVQTPARIAALRGEKGGDGSNVSHQRGDIVKGRAADALKYVAARAIRHHQIGEIDVPLAVALAGEGTPLERELTQNLFHGFALRSRIVFCPHYTFQRCGASRKRA